MTTIFKESGKKYSYSFKDEKEAWEWCSNQNVFDKIVEWKL